MKQIRITFIDLPGHGYYRVNKKQLVKIPGFDKSMVTGYSGMDLTSVYFEEDQDATYLFALLEKAGIKAIQKRSYRDTFSITHNYNPDLFDYVPKVGDEVKVFDKWYYIFKINHKGCPVITSGITTHDPMYRIPKTNPFKYISEVK